MVTIRISIKDFNLDGLQQELSAASLPISGVGWAGFIPLDGRRYTPFPEATRQIGYSSSSGPDVAARGEIRFVSQADLTGPQQTSLDSVLTNHNSATLTDEQGRQDQDIADLTALLSTDRPVFLNHLQTWDSKTTNQKLAACKDMFQIVGKVLRIFIRLHREGGAAI